MNNNPGPGEHDISQNLTRPRTPNINLKRSRSRRDDFLLANLTETPAPSYNVSNVFGSDLKMKMTLGGKAAPKKEGERPGPGHYDSNFTYVKKRSTSVINMSKQKTEIRHGYLEEKKTAAPAVLYNPHKPFGQDAKSKISFGKKLPEPKNDNNPAPGHYESKMD